MATFKLLRFKKGKITADSIVIENETLENNLNFQSGQEINFNQIGLTGLVTGATKTLRFTLPLPRDVEIDSIDNITITKCNAELRGGNGYVNSESGFHDYVGRSGYSVNVVTTSYSEIVDGKTTYRKMKFIIFEIVKTSAYTNISNNTPISFWGDVTLKIS